MLDSNVGQEQQRPQSADHRCRKRDRDDDQLNFAAGSKEGSGTAPDVEIAGGDLLDVEIGARKKIKMSWL